MSAKPLEQIIAESLGIEAARIADDLAFNAIPEWDSLNHVNLMLALEQEYATTIDEDRMVELSTVARIRAFVAQQRGTTA